MTLTFIISCFSLHLNYCTLSFSVPSLPHLISKHLDLCSLLSHHFLSSHPVSCPNSSSFCRHPLSFPCPSSQHGSNLIGMTDLNVPEQLYQYMVGGHRRAQAGANRERHKSPSYQIKVDGPFVFLPENNCEDTVMSNVTTLLFHVAVITLNALSV